MDYFFYTPESKLYGITIFVAVVFFQIAFISWQWFYERRADYLFYIAYMLTSVIYGVIELGEFLPFRFFNTDPLLLKYYCSHTVPLFSVFLYYRFARAFLNLPKTRPKLNVHVVRLEYFILFTSIIMLALRIFGGMDVLEEILFEVGTSCILISSAVVIINFLKNSTPLSRFAMLGAGSLLIGASATFILLVLEKNEYKLVMDPYLPLLIFVIAELLIFSTGLTFKSRMLEKQKFEAEQALLRELRHRQSLELQMFKVRENISRDLHDEIGSGLSRITLLGEVIRKSNGGSEPRIDKIIDAAKEMIEGMSEMVWSLNAKNDLLENLIYYLRRYTTEYFESSEMKLAFNVSGNFNNQPVTGLQRRNLLMVYKEILHNIIKHSKADKVIAELTFINNILRIIVHDNGIGEASLKAGHAGNGISNMHERMEEIKGKCHISYDNGTRVVLELNLDDTSGSLN